MKILGYFFSQTLETIVAIHLSRVTREELIFWIPKVYPLRNLPIL